MAITIKEKINLLQVQIDSIKTLLNEVEEQMDLFVKEFEGQKEYITVLENKTTEDTVAEPIDDVVIEIEEEVIEIISIPDKERTDIRKTFSLNDHYLFKRELFNEDSVLMNKVIDDLNLLSAYEDCLSYINKEMHWWDKENPVVLDFIQRIEKNY
jgi:hypothetical protein